MSNRSQRHRLETHPGSNPTQIIATTCSPATAAESTTITTLTVDGQGFRAGDVIYFDGVACTTAYVSATRLTAASVATGATARTVQVTVRRSTGAFISNGVSFVVT